ncbi:MAG TPA: glycerol-3-phosphate 1-O-acyltransferase PlsY [Thermoanaerobaculia bacterium]|nr:glycerol-3-phosphate 1-O-acyltransferase PlsY [Thermoanaerobaculia bacterium]
MDSALPALVVVVAYLLGSIPFSFLVVKAVAGADIRQHGSRNVGATNVARMFGRAPGIVALLLDLAKGVAAVMLARWMVARPGWPIAADPGGGPLQSREFWIAIAALTAVVGHMYPLWLRFHGGKGVATAAGAFLAMEVRVVAAALIVFVIVLIASRFVSLASIISAATIPLFFRFLTPNAPLWHVLISIVIAILVILKHHSNIARMARGKERRMGEPRD